MAPKKRVVGFKKVATPKAQTLETPSEIASQGVRPSPRYTFNYGDHITSDLVVIGHLYVGDVSELYQVWSTAESCAFTCKLMLPGFKRNAWDLRAFKREARLLRLLVHPNIVRLFGQGVYEGRDFMLQEYLHGPSLLELIDSSPERQMDLQQAIKAIIHVCAAVEHLHSHGYVHGDIKPANVILRGGIPVLVDLGSALELQPGKRPARPVGTDPYMSPEQCLKEELSPASDVYGLGAMLYETLTGRWPYEKEMLKRTKSDAVEERYPQVRQKAPSSPRRYNASIPRELDRLILRCLARDPGRRVGSVRELIRRLAAFLDEEHQLWPQSLHAKARMA